MNRAALAIIAAAIALILIDAALVIGDRRRCRWANETGGEE